MNEVSGRRKHCFTSQRTGFESSEIVVEYFYGVVNKFLGESHAPVVDRPGDLTEVYRFLRCLDGRLFFSDQCSNPAGNREN